MNFLSSLFSSRNKKEKYKERFSHLKEEIEKKEEKMLSLIKRKKQTKSLFVLLVAFYVVFSGTCAALFRHTAFFSTAPFRVFLAGFVPGVFLLNRLAKAVLLWKTRRARESLAALKQLLASEIEVFKKETSYTEIKTLLREYSQEELEREQQATPQPLPEIKVVTNRKLQWVDSALKCIVGEFKEDEHSHALVCTKCKTHNGLVSEKDYHSLAYNCPVCGEENDQKKHHSVLAKGGDTPAQGLYSKP
ncbi:MAG: uncharacterized protein A8A55_0752 [Amphiamblys sp. WSBS2006]|nr:MAG: uncharacterized protein A8A55_0752 [Amphiamblys sp. WSBS2006]